MAATTDRPLVVNADDYGFTRGVSAGILDCVRAGTVTSVSVMVNTPGFASGMARLVGGDLPRLPGVGLHLNLTVGRPVLDPADVPTLVDEAGAFFGLPGLAVRAASGRVDPFDVGREARAQLARLRASGVGVDHLDSHHHVHALPAVRDAVTALSVEEGIRWLRRPVEPVGLHGGALKRLLLGAVWRVSGDDAAPRRPGGRARVRGIGLTGRKGFGAALLAALDRPGWDGVTELVVHPGLADAPLARLDGYRAEREAERAALLSDAVRERLGRGDIRLTDFRAA